MKKMLIAAAIAMAATTASFGAKSGQIGLDFGVSNITAISNANSAPTVGLWWNVSDKIALRPSIGFTNSDNGTTSSTAISFGIAVPIYVANFNKLDLYIAPEFNWATDGGSPANSGMAVGASLGTQVSVAEQVSLFGEMGIGYYKNLTSGAKDSQIGTARTAFGVILHFN